MESTVLGLRWAAQLDRTAKLDAGRVDTAFQVGDRVMLRTKELLDVAGIGKLRQANLSLSADGSTLFLAKGALHRVCGEGFCSSTSPSPQVEGQRRWSEAGSAAPDEIGAQQVGAHPRCRQRDPKPSNTERSRA